MIKEKIGNFIKTQKLLNSEKKYLVALSGGADSTALLLIMQELDYNIEAIHCNFHLRGAESDRDELFCKTLCDKQNIPFHIVHFDTKEYAALHKQSIELAARHLRYAYFEQLRKDINAEAIIVAHHQDDNVETILMNLMRGTGLHGLTGIQPRRDNIIRPLLCVSRNEIEQYLKDRNQNYVIDSTNLIDDVTRNRIRLDLIPQLKKINSNVVDNILNTARHLSQAEEYINSTINKEIEDKDNSHYSIPMSKICNEYALYLLLKPFFFPPKVVEDIYRNINGESGKIYETDKYQLLIDRKTILIRKRKETFKTLIIPETGNYIIDSLSKKIRIETKEIKSNFNIPKEKYKIALDYNLIHFPLTLRQTEEGDRFIPFGMKGSKLISNYLTDIKRNVFQKKEQLVLTDSTKKIIWLVGERTNDLYKISDKSEKALTIEIK